MAIKFVKSLSGESCTTIEKREVAPNTTLAADVAVMLKDGKLMPTAGKPSFICAGEVKNSSAPERVGVYPILSQHIYETTFSVDAAAVHVGDKVTLSANGETATATTADGYATVWQMFGTAAGSKVWVRFE